MRLQFASAPVGLVVSRDGEGDAELSKTYEVVVRAGRDKLRLRFADGQTQLLETAVAAGQIETLPVSAIVVQPPPAPSMPEPPAPDPQPEPSMWTGGREVAVAVAGGGALLLIGAVVAGAIGRSDFDASHVHCGATGECDTTGMSDVSSANAAAHASIALEIGGAAAIGVGAVLWFTKRPTARLAVAPMVAPDVVGLAIGGVL